MLQLLARPWPWYVSGPLIGLFVPVLLLIGNKTLGMSSTFRAICAATAGERIEFFRYNWKQQNAWTMAMALGLLIGAAITVAVIGVPTPAISTATQVTLLKLGMHSAHGLVPAEMFNWHSLLTLRGVIAMLGGGFLVGFGTAYGGGCTSGHGVMGLASLQIASLIALIGIFTGGVLATFFLVPFVF
jgi:uncharacterized membrane protein YedE/YeeE